MNKKSKYILFGTALLTMATGSAYAFNGYGNCDQRGPGMQRGQFNQMQGNRYDRPPMHWKQGKRGQRQKAGMKVSPMRGIYRLNDLSKEQQIQLEALQQVQQEWRNGQQIARQAHREEMKEKVKAILTDDQRLRLNRWRPLGG